MNKLSRYLLHSGKPFRFYAGGPIPFRQEAEEEPEDSLLIEGAFLVLSILIVGMIILVISVT